jgi:intraflagellar transport protein 172
LENYYSVSALAWKKDGSKLTLGSMSGAVDVFDCCIKRVRYKGRFEFTYTSNSQVIVKRLSTGSRIVLKSNFGYDVVNLDIFKDHYLIANTSDTLLIGDLQTCRLTEIPWQLSGSEKYYFDYPEACMIFNAGELSIVEYGTNEILGNIRTEYMNPHLLR